MNEKKICYILICAIMSFCFVILMISSAANIKLNTISSSISKEIPYVVIDAGHGGEDGGAIINDKISEKNINLDIANKTADLTTFLGFETTKTRSTDTALSSQENTIRQRKVSDMKKRLEIYNADSKNIVVSIHQNKFSQEKYKGTQIFYSKNNTKSQYLAEKIKFSVKGLLQPDNTREIKQAGNDIYLLKNTTQPAVIVECGFISNKEECQKLIDDVYQKQMAFAITCGLLNYCNTEN